MSTSRVEVSDEQQTARDFIARAVDHLSEAMEQSPAQPWFPDAHEDNVVFGDGAFLWSNGFTSAPMAYVFGDSKVATNAAELVRILTASSGSLLAILRHALGVNSPRSSDQAFLLTTALKISEAILEEPAPTVNVG